MAYLLKRVEVTGFQSRRDIVVPLNRDINFLIGRNGTGKTTFIRLLHACLNLDVTEISRTAFASISVVFTDTTSDRNPTLHIERRPDAPGGLRITFRTHARSRITSYFIDDEAPGNLNRLAALLSRDSDNPPEATHPLSDLRRTFRRQVQFSWLPLQRALALARRDFVLSDSLEEPINKKIKELLGRITSYLAILDSRISAHNRRFQRDVFSSYLQSGLFDVSSFLQLDLQQERNQLTKMFDEMDYPTEDINDNLDGFFSRAAETQEHIEPAATRRPVPQIVDVISSNALHRIVSYFQQYTSSKAATLFPREQFVLILSRMFYNKEVYFDEGNVLSVRSFEQQDELQLGPGGKLDIFDLSSGEKQLLVILSEALLQQHREFIYVADEPELSLHVEWQGQLVQTVRDMNDKAQFVFATHSPDIVGPFQDRAIDFENV